MSGKKPTPKRRITIRMTSREKADPQAIMLATKNALSGHGITVVYKTVGTGDPPEEAETVKDEPLETAVRELASATLDAKTAEEEKKAADSRREAAAVADEVAASRRGLGSYLKHLAGRLCRVAVEWVAKRLGKGKGE